MYFTLFFDRTKNGSDDGPSDSVDLVFQPCPVWIGSNFWENKEINIVPRSDKPEYELGNFRILLENLGLDVESFGSPLVRIVIHNGGHGSQKDLDTLIKDLILEKFEPQVLN